MKGLRIHESLQFIDIRNDNFFSLIPQGYFISRFTNTGFYSPGLPDPAFDFCKDYKKGRPYSLSVFSDLQSGQTDFFPVLLYTWPQLLHRYLYHFSSSISRLAGPPMEHMLHNLTYHDTDTSRKTLSCKCCFMLSGVRQSFIYRGALAPADTSIGFAASNVMVTCDRRSDFHSQLPSAHTLRISKSRFIVALLSACARLSILP
jgi:hypothetical protein